MSVRTCRGRSTIPFSRIYFQVSPYGGIRPVPRRRSRLAAVLVHSIINGPGGPDIRLPLFSRKRTHQTLGSPKPASSRRSAIASPVYRPCFNAFLFPEGAHVDFPRCMRQLSVCIAGDWHGFPFSLSGFDPPPGQGFMSPTMALSALTVTCFTVMDCCPAPRWRSRR